MGHATIRRQISTELLLYKIGNFLSGRVSYYKNHGLFLSGQALKKIPFVAAFLR